MASSEHPVLMRLPRRGGMSSGGAMATPSSHYLSCAGRELHYVEWPAEGLADDAETVIA